MKTFLALLLISCFSQAVTFELIHPCTGKTYKRLDSLPLPSPQLNVGRFSMNQLSRLGVPFEGEDQNLLSIMNTPSGSDAVVKISPDHLLAYGWCYHVNGKEPGLMPSFVFLKSYQDHVKWFYAYSEFKYGQWRVMCNPAHLLPLKTYCR